MVLKEVLARLDFGVVVTTTPEFEAVTGRNLAGGLKLEALRIALEMGYAEKDAEMDGDTISVYADESRFPCPMFRIVR